MFGDQGGAVEDAHEAIVGDEGDDALALGHRSRHRVPVGVELHEGLAVEVDQLDPIGRGQRCGERQEARALLGEDVADGALGQDRVGPRVRNRVDEAPELGIALVDADDRAAGEEAVAQVADRALDLALVLRSAHGT